MSRWLWIISFPLCFVLGIFQPPVDPMDSSVLMFFTGLLVLAPIAVSRLRNDVYNRDGVIFITFIIGSLIFWEIGGVVHRHFS